jgi:chaperonin GroEL
VLEELKKKMEFDEEKTGVDIVYKALAEPVRKIAENCGVDAGWVLRKVEESKDKDYGFDAVTLEFGSMIKRGVVDPAKVVRSALENAASVATMVLTTEALITDIPEKKDNAPATPSMPEY